MFLDIKINRYRQQPIHLIPRPTNDNNNKKNPTFHIMYIEIQIQYIFTQFNIPRTHRQYIVLYNFFHILPFLYSLGANLFIQIFIYFVGNSVGHVVVTVGIGNAMLFFLHCFIHVIIMILHIISFYTLSTYSFLHLYSICMCNDG